MSEKSNRDHDADDANDRELIDMEFESMVEGLSLDESSPSTYLDELENFVDQNNFIVQYAEFKFGVSDNDAAC